MQQSTLLYNNNNLPYVYRLLVPGAVIMRIHIQPISTVVFLLPTAVPAPLVSNVLTDSILARYEWVIRDNLAVSDLSKIIP